MQKLSALSSRHIRLGLFQRNSYSRAFCSSALQEKSLIGPNVASSITLTAEGVYMNPQKLFFKKMILDTCSNFVKQGNLRQSRNLMLDYMKKCATHLVHEKPEVKVEIAETLLDYIKESNGIFKLNTTVYNLLLRAYNKNNHKFKPSEIMDQMRASNCKPNKKTFEELVIFYCNQGSIDVATDMLADLETMDIILPRDKEHAAMVTAYSRAGDLQAAEGVVDSFKITDATALNTVYTSLLCAYAERGLMENIEKTLDKMKENNISLWKALVSVMDSLSQHGHGSLVKNVLSLIESSPWQTKDLHSLYLGCLARGDIQTSVILMSRLFLTNGVSEDTLYRYFSDALRHEKTLIEAIDILEQEIDIGSYTWLPHIFTTAVVMYAPKLQYNRKPLEKGSLLHPWGKRWSTELRYALNLLSKKKNLQKYHFLPLLTYYCSEGDIDELVITFYTILKNKSLTCTFMPHYIDSTFSNAGVTMEEYFATQLKEDNTDHWWHGQLLTFQCALGKWDAAVSTIKKMDSEELVKKHTGCLESALQYFFGLCNEPGDYFNFVVTLIKYNVTSLLLKFYWRNKKLNMDLFNRLSEEGVIFYIDRNVINLHWYLSRNNMLKDPRELFYLLEKVKNYCISEGAVVALYKQAAAVFGITEFGLRKSAQFYAMMTEEKKEDFNVRCIRVQHLIAMKQKKSAVDEFLALLALERPVPVIVWKRVVCAAYTLDPCLGDDLLQKMQENDLHPDGYMLYDLLQIHIDQKDIKRAEDILVFLQERDIFHKFKNSKKKDVNISSCYQKIFLLWAENEDLDSLKELEELQLTDKTLFWEVKVMQCLHSEKIEEALKALAEIEQCRIKFLQVLMKVLVKKGHPLNEWRAALLNIGLPGPLVDTVILFTYMDCGFKYNAQNLLRFLENLQPSEVKWRMQSKQAKLYHSLFKEWGVRVTADGEIIFLDDTSQDTDDSIVNMDDVDRRSI